MYTLIVIDMQPETFIAARDDGTVQNVIREINQAKQNGAAVLFVEYQFNGETDPRLIDAAKGIGAEKYKVIHKRRDDGSDRIIKALEANGWPKDRLLICGVNTDACVLRTVQGLDEKLNGYGFNGIDVDIRKDVAKIEVVWDACNSDSVCPLRTKEFTRHCSRNVKAVNIA